ncbi:MAG: hypothetical protein AAF628_26170 [Planctomycetota bacterium]
MTAAGIEDPEAAGRRDAGRRRRWTRLGLAGAALVGVGLVVLPWLPRDRPMPLPPQLDEGGAGHRLLAELAADVDRVCATGDVAALQELVTPELWQDLLRRVTAAGATESLEVAFRQLRSVVGDLATTPLLAGVAGDDQAILVFSRMRPAVDAGYPTSRSLFGLRFRWSGRRFLLDAKENRVVQPGEEPQALSQELADALYRRPQ